MKAVELSLHKEVNQSFTFYHEKKSFTVWHYHPEYELVYIKNGAGRRMVGDSIEKFEEGDMMLLGPNLPHEWLCNKSYYSENDKEFKGEAIVVQFLENFLGETFFHLPENRKLKKFLDDSSQGCLILDDTKEKLIAILEAMVSMDSESRLYSMFDIFKIFANTSDYSVLSSPNFRATFLNESDRTLRKVIEFTMQNFQRKIQIKEVLSLANMSNTTFTVFFKKHYSIPYSEYLMKVRIGYACSLLTDTERNISQIAYDSGFENLSNFNRQFKKAKDITPKDFRRKSQ
ncbi:MAG: AraC family transcriptional regulator [Leadbetterella sp.]